MSIKVFNNNYVSNTGLKLPTIYIDKVVVTTEQVGGYAYTKFNVSLVSFFKKPSTGPSGHYYVEATDGTLGTVADTSQNITFFTNYVDEIIEKTDFYLSFLPKMNVVNFTDSVLNNLKKYNFVNSDNTLDITSKLKNGTLMPYDLCYLNDVFENHSPMNDDYSGDHGVFEHGGSSHTTPLPENKLYFLPVNYLSSEDGFNAVAMPRSSTQTIRSNIFFPLDKSLFTQETISNDSGEQFIKVSMPIEIQAFNGDPANESKNFSFGTTNVWNAAGIDKAVKNNFSFDFACFSTTLDSSEFIPVSPVTGLTFGEGGYQRAQYLKNIKNQEISDVTYETIASEGTYGASTSAIYVNAVDGSVYNSDLPIQSLNNLYYATPGLTLSDIVGTFRNLIGSTDDEQLQNSYDNLNYILETNGESVDLLIKIDEFRRVYPDKTNLTPSGKFFQSFQALLLSADQAIVSSGTQVKRAINTNPTVVDVRTFPSNLNSRIVTARERIGKRTKSDGFGDPKETIVEDNDNNYINIDNALYGTFTDPVEVEHGIVNVSEAIPSGDKFTAFMTALHSRGQVPAWWGSNIESLEHVQQLIDAAFTEIKTFLLITVDGSYGDDNLMYDQRVADSDYRYVINKFIDEILACQTNSDKIFVPAPTPDDPFAQMTSPTMGDVFATLGTSGVPTSEFGGQDYNILQFADRFQEKFFTGNRGPKYIIGYGEGQKPGAYTFTINNYNRGGAGTAAELLTALDKYYDFATLYDLYTTKKVSKYNHFLFGYWWFDYEKALKEHSILSFCFPIRKIENLFGKNFANENFKLFRTRINKYSKEPGIGIREPSARNPPPTLRGFPELSYCLKEGVLESYYYDYINKESCKTVSNFMERTAYPGGGGSESTATVIKYRKKMEGSITCNTALYGEDTLGNAGVDVLSADDVEYTYNVLRPVNFSNEELNNYRLMCFEHQEVSGHIGEDNRITVGHGESAFDGNYQNCIYDYEVSIMDRTYLTVKSIVDSYKNVLRGGLFDYLDTAADECNFESLTGPFNQFFIDAQVALYEDNPSSAPWYTAPVIYYLHDDLLNNTYGGNLEQVFVAAKKETLKISPQTGTYEQLESFFDKFQNFYNEHYSPFGSLVHSIAFVTGLGAPIGGVVDPTGDMSAYSFETYNEVFDEHVLTFKAPKNTLTGIPEPVNMVVYQPPETDRDTAAVGGRSTFIAPSAEDERIITSGEAAADTNRRRADGSRESFRATSFEDREDDIVFNLQPIVIEFD